MRLQNNADFVLRFLHRRRFLFGLEWIGLTGRFLGNRGLSLKSFVSAVRDDEFMANKSRRRHCLATHSILVAESDSDSDFRLAH